jgi:hypothetical protein
MTARTGIGRFLNEYQLGCVSQIAGHRDQFSSRHQNLELGYENSVDSPIVDDAHQSVAEMGGDRSVYVEKGQANNIRKWRIVFQQTHNRLSRRQASQYLNTTVYYTTQQNHRSDKNVSLEILRERRTDSIAVSMNEFQFVGPASSHPDECAPIAASPATSRYAKSAIGASNSRRP